ncbi:hypothetical protein BG842_03275 [Haladaptatus sp. W1]|nr:hypothetical protein BG842_03275 [Haladaptatus sp. W1]
MRNGSKKWLLGLKSAILNKDKSKLLEYLDYAYCGVCLSITSRYPIGTNIFEKDWDALLVLDACRVDALREVAPEYDFIESVDSIWSVGSSSHEWYANTFNQKYKYKLNKTALISSNPFAAEVLYNDNHPPIYPTPILNAHWNTISDEDIGHFEPTQQHKRPFDNVSDSAPVDEVQDPNYVTDRGIVAGREDYDRLIIHYFQPHRPFIYDLIEGGEMTEKQNDPYGFAQKEEIDHGDLWPMYLDNLRLVLDSINNLLKNLDADKVIITADHGELIGELGQYGHFECIPHPDLKKVPWVETTATDKKTRMPDEEPSIKSENNTEKRLRELGYIK